MEFLKQNDFVTCACNFQYLNRTIRIQIGKHILHLKTYWKSWKMQIYKNSFVIFLKTLLRTILCTGTRWGSVFAKHSTMPPLAYVFEWQHPMCCRIVARLLQQLLLRQWILS